MELTALGSRAMEIRRLYAAYEQATYGRSWTAEEVALGLVGDVGDLAKLVMAHEGIRNIADAEHKMAHELADCLWAILVLAHSYGIDLEQAFLQTMDHLEGNLLEQRPAC